MLFLSFPLSVVLTLRLCSWLIEVFFCDNTSIFARSVFVLRGHHIVVVWIPSVAILKFGIFFETVN